MINMLRVIILGKRPSKICYLSRSTKCEYSIYSRNDEEHASNLIVALQTHKDCQLFFKFSKCEFWLT